MEKPIFWIIFVLLLVLIGLCVLSRLPKFQKGNKVAMSTPQAPHKNIIDLPQPELKGKMSLEEVIFKRRSRREYTQESLTLAQVSQILWSGQGITDEKTGFRSSPSAGALYPLDIYLVVGRNGVEDLPEGVYHFLPQGQKLEKISTEDLRESLTKASLNQSFIAQAPMVLVITGEYERTMVKYGERGRQYVHQEAGHTAQNIYLQVESLGLGTVTIGAFNEEEIINILDLPSTHHPLYVMPVGQVE
ncbi:SagB/ThcOx family dehydrogenase [Patescibacteria group bacterium]|nr:SagB/ThcOx family dehydrogenase [Patescibacteria group bacterium]